METVLLYRTAGKILLSTFVNIWYSISHNVCHQHLKTCFYKFFSTYTQQIIQLVTKRKVSKIFGASGDNIRGGCTVREFSYEVI